MHRDSMTSENSLVEADRLLNIIISPVLMLLSATGNALAVLVLGRKSFRSMPMAVYLRFLAVMDSGTVLTGLLPRFIFALTDYDVRGTSELSCQFQVYVVYIFTELSAWTLVIMTSERVLSIIKPHKVKIVCTKFRSYFILSATVTFFVIANLPIFFIFGKSALPKDNAVIEGNNGKKEIFSTNPMIEGNVRENASTSNASEIVFRFCITKGNNRAVMQTWYLTHFLKQSLLPFVILFSFNIVIIVGLVRRKNALLKPNKSIRERRFSLQRGSISIISRVFGPHPVTNPGTKLVDSQCDTSPTTITTSGPNFRHDSSSTIVTNPGPKSRREASLTITLVTVNAVFLVCTFPIGIYQLVAPNLPERNGDEAEQTLVFTFLVFVLYLNNTLNFLLYCVTGSRFRAELRAVCCCQHALTQTT